MKAILLLVPDLFFETRISDGARQLGFAVATVRSGESPAEAITRVRPALFIVALDAPAMRDAIEAAKMAGVPSLAFGPHVRTELFAEARAAGASQVVARSAMHSDLEKLIS